MNEAMGLTIALICVLFFGITLWRFSKYYETHNWENDRPSKNKYTIRAEKYYLSKHV